VVFAAASLTESFTQIAEGFEAANPNATVTLNFGASSALAQQIISGAPAGVFASASPATMAQVTGNGDADGEPTVFVRNRLEIAVPAGNPGDVSGLADFAEEDLTIALCAEQVPCGAAALRAFEAAGITPAPDTLEQDVKATLTKVELGEVDAAVVYRTDVIAAGDTVEGIEFPEAAEAVNDYPIVTLAAAPNPEAAQAFVGYVLSEEGQQVLADAGFDGP
jgi:molybdate transport system substrate-binding protein